METEGARITCEINEDPEEVHKLERSKEQARRGEGISLEELREEFRRDDREERWWQRLGRAVRR